MYMKSVTCASATLVLQRPTVGVRSTEKHRCRSAVVSPEFKTKDWSSTKDSRKGSYLFVDEPIMRPPSLNWKK